MTISVAIATYNRASLVVEAIEAALAQSPPPDEIVVTDDASTDQTPQVLAEWAARDPRLRVIRQPTNTGGVPNWNRAMDAARGDLIAWCSDDDRFLPGHLAESAAYLEAHPEVGLVHASFVDSREGLNEGIVNDGLVNERLVTGGSCEREPRPLRSAEPLAVDRGNRFWYLMRYYDWPFHPSTLVMRRQVWEMTGPFDPRYQLADTDWFVRATSQFRAVMLPRHGVINRRHPGNWSNRMGSARMQREIFEIVDRAMREAWPRATLKRGWWRVLWSLNVRLRLALTVRERLRSGHLDAALSSWEALARHAGRPLPGLISRTGEWVIRHWPGAGRGPVAGGPSVSPL